jgi:hypothetical protein
VQLAGLSLKKPPQNNNNNNNLFFIFKKTFKLNGSNGSCRLDSTHYVKRVHGSCRVTSEIIVFVSCLGLG